MSVQRPSNERRGRHPPEIIDLTESPPCPLTPEKVSKPAYNLTSRQDFDEQNDLNFAVALQAKLDKEARYQQHVYPPHSSEPHGRASPVPNLTVPDDEFARKLQEQFDAETIQISDDHDADCTHDDAKETTGTTQPSDEDVQALTEKLNESYTPPLPRTFRTTPHHGKNLPPLPSKDATETKPSWTTIPQQIKSQIPAALSKPMGKMRKQKSADSLLLPAAEKSEAIYYRSEATHNKKPVHFSLDMFHEKDLGLAEFGENWMVSPSKTTHKLPSQEILPPHANPVKPSEKTPTAKEGVKSSISTHSKPILLYPIPHKIADFPTSAVGGKWFDLEAPSDEEMSDLDSPEIEEEGGLGGGYSRLPKGTGYGRGGATPFVGSRWPSHAPLRKQLAEVGTFAQEQKAADTKAQNIFKALTSLLPDANNDSQFDTNPPRSLAPMLAQSNILHKAAELLRNDSLNDATKRIHLYHQVISFVQKLATHYSTSALLFARRDLHVDQTNLHQMTIDKVVPRCEKTPSIFACGQNLIKQSKAMLAAFGVRQEELAAADTEEMLTLCTHITDLADLLAATNSTPTGQNSTKDNPWKQYQHVFSVSDTDDRDILRNYHFKDVALNYVVGRPGRMKRLVEETVALKTSLPPGIFVRYGTSRLDTIKALIIGPDDTPYEGGIFEFDVICPAEYPQTPPEFHFKTTGGGKAHFNPNLYPCGKVCLSLLNTWPGEQWDPSKSTLLQVLVSLQSMVFCESPWYNEPGRESGSYDSKISQRYNHQIQVLTVKHGLMDWLDAKKHSIWDDIILHYFKYNQQNVLRTTRNWGKNNRALTETMLQQLAKEMQRVK
ncbi:MAG: hypothetical protein Q9160_001024 [Pyrenula sp. 1 TL-2023]